MMLDNDIMQINIIKKYMINQASKLATKLHKMYPKKFTKESLHNELLVLNAYISRCNFSINTEEAIVKSRSKKTKLYIKKPVISDEYRCYARVWDIKCIKQINKETGDYINYGRRCNHKRVESGDYCKMHNYKNTHGDYREPNVPEYLRQHFEKAYKKYGDSSLVCI